MFVSEGKEMAKGSEHMNSERGPSILLPIGELENASKQRSISVLARALPLLSSQSVIQAGGGWCTRW